MTILAVSPHPDDVEIGCFGTLARLAPHEPVGDRRPDLRVGPGILRKSESAKRSRAPSSSELRSNSSGIPTGASCRTPKRWERYARS